VTGTVGTVDKASAEVKAKEKREAEEQAIEAQKGNEKKRAKKMRGKDKSAHREGAHVQHQHEALRNKNKLAYLQEYKRAKAQTEHITGDLEFLGKVEGKFDAFEAAVTGQETEKKQKSL
jgi:hypothetical protein